MFLFNIKFYYNKVYFHKNTSFPYKSHTFNIAFFQRFYIVSSPSRMRGHGALTLPKQNDSPQTEEH